MKEVPTQLKQCLLFEIQSEILSGPWRRLCCLWVYVITAVGVNSLQVEPAISKPANTDSLVGLKELKM